MFNIFKKKERKDPILEMLEDQRRQLEEIRNSINMDKVEAEIAKAECALKQLGYTDEDLKRIELKTRFEVVKDSE